MLEELRRTVEDEVSAAALDEQMKLAIVERDAQALEREVARFEQERGRAPSSLRELVQAGQLSALPADPFGGEYRWNADEKRVRSSANPFRFTLREGPQRPGFQVQRSPETIQRMPR
jgi:hypothetical protein